MKLSDVSQWLVAFAPDEFVSWCEANDVVSDASDANRVRRWATRYFCKQDAGIGVVNGVDDPAPHIVMPEYPLAQVPVGRLLIPGEIEEYTNSGTDVEKGR